MGREPQCTFGRLVHIPVMRVFGEMVLDMKESFFSSMPWHTFRRDSTDALLLQKMRGE